MRYYVSKKLDIPFAEAIAKVKERLAGQGFGVLSEIDVKATMRAKLDVDFRDYVILGACNPPFAFEALQQEDKIGTLLPCNVMVQTAEGGGVKVAAVDPLVSMQFVDNEALAGIAARIRDKLAVVIEAL